MLSAFRRMALRHHACPPAAEIHKTALGAEDSVSWEYFEDTLDAVKRLQREGYEVLAVEQVEGSLKLNTFRIDPAKRYASFSATK